ncbi:MAG TPA: hypothetical protein VFN25_10090 [Dokdonella sp.]|uniref:hypothetical protein n=1 Tax=Dokdonella sp. TaxID=2291710 RepID=UPI002D80FA9B|nr:hypothetical protein [Dokdonella sp.]HET9033244.1 hypothetical protein [Dokdonella sp.]
MNTNKPRRAGSATAFCTVFLGCLTLSAVHVDANPPDTLNAASSSLSYPTACVLFGDGFELAPGPLFFDGFDFAPVQLEGPGEPIDFITSGGYTIHINLDNVTISDPLGLNKVVSSGHQNEYLNGKHIKDWGGEINWDDDRRSLILADGTKLTLEAQGHPNLTLRTSIYDGQENLQIDNRCNSITHRSVDPGDTQQRDQAQFDGEVATFQTDMTLGTATYSNAYNEDRNFNTIDITTPLGVTGGFAHPGLVNDLYDDPRRPDT